MSKAQLRCITAAFLCIRQDKKRYCNRWIIHDVLYDLLVEQELVSLKLVPKDRFNRIASKACGECGELIDHKLNTLVGVLRMNKQMKGQKIYGYYFRVFGEEECKEPPKDADDFYTVAFK